MATVRELLSDGKRQLTDCNAASLEAEVLLAFAMGVSRAFLFAHRDEDVPAPASRQYLELLARRAVGEPVAYITGEREFWSLRLSIAPAVLIPRPESERLVEAALERIPLDAPLRIADLGTGSGAIALALAHERPQCEIHASEISQAALALARENARRLKLERVKFHAGSWFDPLTGKFDIVVSNPPYVAEGDPHLSQGDVQFEPRSALLGGADGLEAIRAISREAPAHLVSGGWLLLEHGHDQAGECQAILADNDFEFIETLCDLEGTKRVTLGAWSAAAPG